MAQAAVLQPFLVNSQHVRAYRPLPKAQKTGSLGAPPGHKIWRGHHPTPSKGMKYRTLANVGLWVWREAEQGWQEHGCVSLPRNIASSHLCKGRRSTVMLTTVTRGESWSCCSWRSQRDTSKCFTYNSDQSPHDWTVLQSSEPDYKISFQFGLKWICRIGISDVKWKWIPQISIYFIGKHYWFFYRLTLFFSSSPLPTPTFSRIERFDLREAV